MHRHLSLLDTVFIGVLLTIFGVVVLHAPLSVGLSTAWPDYSLVIKSWKEILLGVALLLGVVILTTKKEWAIIRSPVLYIIAAFAAINVLLIPAFYQGFEPTVAGLFINLRFLLFFALVYVAIRLYPQLSRLFLITFVAGAVVVIGFAVLQLTVLPHDVLKYIGYNESTIMPFLTVDENINYIRINSTLRGPNPLGAYVVIVLALAVAVWLRPPRKLNKTHLTIIGILGIGSALALWASYSRSAALAGMAAVGVIVLVTFGRRITKPMWIAFAVVALALTGSIVALRDTQFVSQVILHEDPHEGNDVNSNDGHAESLVEGVQRLARQPLGAGIGSTGSASLLGEQPFIMENQYLYVAHESGWVGLGLFLAVTYLVLVDAWRKRTRWLALGVFASGIGLALASLLLPVWADDTVSIVWWGLAAIVCALPAIPAVKGAVKPVKKRTLRAKDEA